MPPNVHYLSSPTFQSKLSQLRDVSIPSSAVRRLVSEMTTILARDALDATPAATSTSSKEKIALVVILRSGMAMSDAFLNLLPEDASLPVYHLGLFREKETLQPVEYYNKLPLKDPLIRHAFVVDPLIATGGTAAAAISILRDWGVEKISFLSILATEAGLTRAADTWREGVKFYVGAVDEKIDSHGYISPGVGDIGDRLFGTALN